MADVLHRLSCCPLASHLLHTTETHGETGRMRGQLHEQLKSDKSDTAILAEAMAKDQCCIQGNTVIFAIQYGDAKSSNLKCHQS